MFMLWGEIKRKRRIDGEKGGGEKERGREIVIEFQGRGRERES